MLLKKMIPALALTLLGGMLNTAFAEKLSVAATPVPHAELLEFIKPELAKQGVELEILVFTDYVQPNQQVADGKVDANYFQHKPYLQKFNAERKTDLVSVGQIHVEPFGAYSTKVKSLTELKTGALIAIPSDASNGARALLLLQTAGLIKLADPENILATSRDIIENPKKLKFKELEAATLPRVLADVDMALINTNYALEAGFNPSKDALVIEGGESPYANHVVTVSGKEHDERIVKLVKSLQSDAVRQFIAEKYQGAVAPAF